MSSYILVSFLELKNKVLKIFWTEIQHELFIKKCLVVILSDPKKQYAIHNHSQPVLKTESYTTHLFAQNNMDL